MDDKRKPDGIVLTEAQKKSRRQRSIAIALALGVLVMLFFAVTIVRGPPFSCGRLTTNASMSERDGEPAHDNATADGQPKGEHAPQADAAMRWWRRFAACSWWLMVGASYAAVPFYNWFCRATGFNGTTQVATGEADRSAAGAHGRGPLRFQCRARAALEVRA